MSSGLETGGGRGTGVMMSGIWEKGLGDVGTRRRRGLHLRDISQGTGGLEGSWL